MQSFATEFPVSPERSPTDFLHAVEDWILGSPHTRLKPGDIEKLDGPGESELRKGSEHFERQWVLSGVRHTAGARYIRRDDNLEWVTTVLFSRMPESSWVGVRVSCESLHPSTQLPPAKKPIIIRTLLTKLGGGQDGPLTVTNSPSTLRNSEITLAAQLIDGDAGCRLPIVYVSAGFGGGHIVNCARLASSLAGMAHVVVEPNRAFSVRLKDEVRGNNVYGGTVGVYWPDGFGRKAFFLGRELATGVEIEEAVAAEVQAALCNRRPIDECTWSYLEEIASRKALEALKASGSQELDKYVETFDKDLAAKDERLMQANREILRLQAELRAYQAKSPLGMTSLLRSGREQDFYPNEVLGIVRSGLEDAAERVVAGSRRRHVLEDVLAANPLEEDLAEIQRERLKDTLRGSRTVDAKIRRALTELGFSISEEGKHYKLTYQGDDRYVFTLAKSGSDHRGGLNAASDIGRLIF